MTKKLQMELKDILQNNRGNLYDFICNNYLEMSKEEVKDFTKECISLLYQMAEEQNIKNGKAYDRYDTLHKEVLSNITEWTSLLDENE